MYLLDENLSPKIAQALRLFSLDIKTIEEAFGRWAVSDKDIVDWLEKTGAIWLTEDVSARKQHEHLLKTKRISAIWIRQPKQGLVLWEQFKIIVREIDRIAEIVKHCHGAVHIQIGKKTKATITWDEKP